MVFCSCRKEIKRVGGQLEIGPSSFRSSGPPGFRIEAARGPVRISPSALRSPSRPHFRTSPSFRILEPRPSINTHSNFAGRGESPRMRARAGLETRFAQHKPPSLEAPTLRAHTRFVHHEAQNGMEGLGRLITPNVRPISTETSHSARPGQPHRMAENQAQKPKVIAERPKNAAGNREIQGVGGRVKGVETPVKPVIQEKKEGQSGVSPDKLNTQSERRQSLNTEHKKYPILRDKLSKIFEQSSFPTILPEVGKPGVLEAAVNYDLQTATRRIIVDSGVSALPGRAELSGLRIVTGAEARAVLMTGETAYAQRIFEAAQATTPGTEAAKSLQALPELTIETNRAVQTPELQLALNPLEKPQLIKTYQALLPALGHEKALNLVGQAVEKRVQMLNPAQKLALAEKIVSETEPEQVLAGLSEEERIRVEIYVKKIIRERRVRLKAVVDEPSMQARENKIIKAWEKKFTPGVEVISGAEFIEEVGPQTPDEVSPIVPEGRNDGGGDQIRNKIKDLELKRGDLPLVIGIHEDDPTVRIVEEDDPIIREVTDQEIYTVLYKQIGDMDKIIEGARQRAVVMLAGLPG